MYQRTTVQAFAPSRPTVRLTLRVRNVRCRSSILPGDRQRGEEKGSNTMETNPAPEQMNNPPPNHQPVRHNQPSFSKTRQQRAAQISNEVRMLQRDQPAPGVRQSASSEPAIRSRNIDPEAIGMSSGDRSVPLGGQMGNNDFAGREGPGNQSVGTPIRFIDEEGSLYRQDGNPDAEMNPSGGATPSEGGEGLMDINDYDDEDFVFNEDEDFVFNEDDFEGDLEYEFNPADVDHMPDEDDIIVDYQNPNIDISRFAYTPDTSNQDTRGRNQRPTEPESDDRDMLGLVLSDRHELHLLEQFDKEDVTDVYFKPDTVSKEAFLQLGQGGATIAANNGLGMIEDRLKLLGEPEQDGIRVARHMRKRLRAGHLVSLANVQERNEINKDQNKTKWAALPKQFGTTLVDRMVRGQYADIHAKPHAQQELNHVGMNMIRNGTYLAKDGERFLKKVQSLLPTETESTPAPRARR
ncbi:hypothetical protein MBLNU457_7756t1 [Dothideomycetes sp. NU457]